MGKTIANKKNVDNNAGYVVKPIAGKDIEKQADFGTFKITRTRECIAYTNYVGYSVITKPYTTTPEGKATELSLYAWLNYALEQKEYLEQHKDEKHPDLDFTNGEWLEQIKVITEANLTKPCVVFTDADYARLGTRIKCNPAVKTAADRAALRRALSEGIISSIAEIISAAICVRTSVDTSSPSPSDSTM